jgi:O-antigen ligase
MQRFSRAISNAAQPPAESGGRDWVVGAPAFSLARVLLVVTLLAAPWAFGAVQPWAWATLTALALLLLFVWGVGCAQQGAVRMAWSPLYWPALGFFLLGAIQFFAHLTLDRISARESLLKLGTDLILFFLAGQLMAAGADRHRVLTGFGFTVALFAFALSMFGIFQFFTSRGQIYWVVKSPGWTFGPYVNHNHYAGLMEMLIPISVTYILSRPRHDPIRLLLGFAALFPITSLLLSGSRGGLISLLAEVLLLGGILALRGSGISRKSLATAATLGITAAVALFFWADPGSISKRLATVVHLEGPAEAELGSRLVVARDSLRILRDHPWLGGGLGSFEVAFPKYQTFPSDVLWDHAHNDYAEALAETGIAGGILMLVALAMFYRLAFGHLSERLRKEAGWIQLGAAVGCCGLLVHSFVDFNLHIPANAAWFAVCAAIAVQRRTVLAEVRNIGAPPEEQPAEPAAPTVSGAPRVSPEDGK